MKVAHLVAITPHRSGLYETTRDLVAAERELGVDARLVHPFQPDEDRGVPIGEDRFVAEADILVSHSGLGKYEKTPQPIVHVMHGRPRSSFLLEQSEVSPVYSMLNGMRADDRYKAFVTFWPSFVDYWQLILPAEKLWAFSPPVDLTVWSPEGKADYEFGGRRGDVNIICVDPWRHDKDPFHVINAFWHYATRHPNVKLHLYGVTNVFSALRVLFQAVSGVGGLGEVRPIVSGIDTVYRSADLLITGHTIATRTVREAMACGCPVVAGGVDAEATVYADVERPKAFAEKIDEVVCTLQDDKDGTRRRCRAVAEDRFAARMTAAGMVSIFDSILGSG